MNKLLMILLLSTSMLSCSSYSYFYSKMDSKSNNVNKSDNGTFVVQSDSLDVFYRFYGRNAPITIAVENKSSAPVYISWKESGVVLEDTVQKNKKRVKISAARYDKGAIDFGRFQLDPDAPTRVAPHSKIEKQIVELSNFNFHKIDKSLFSAKYVDHETNGKQKEYKAINYNERNSPIRFKTYLTIYPQTTKNVEPIVFETNFYLSQLINGKKDDPYSIKEFRDQQGDFFYVKKENGRAAKNIGNGLAVLGLSTLWVADSMLNWTDEQDSP